MNAIVLYVTKSGATSECANLLAEKLRCPAYDLAKSTPDISGFDTIIIGAGIRMGKVYKPACSFIQNNLSLLLNKKTALYFCNAYPETFQKSVEKSIPAELAESAVCIKSFGGKPPFNSAPISAWLNENNFQLFLESIR